MEEMGDRSGHLTVQMDMNLNLREPHRKKPPSAISGMKRLTQRMGVRYADMEMWLLLCGMRGSGGQRPGDSFRSGIAT